MKVSILFHTLLLQLLSGNAHALPQDLHMPLSRFSIAVLAGDEELLDQTIAQISDPSSPLYGQYLSKDDALSLLKPQDGTVSEVKRWLRDMGIHNHEIETDGHMLHVRTLNQLDVTRLEIPPGLKHNAVLFERDDAVRRTEPRGVDGSRQAPATTGQQPSTDCNSQMTPECLQTLYHMGDYQADPTQNTILGIIGFNQSAQYKELDMFLRKYAPEAIGSSFSIESVNGGKTVQSNDALSGEANTDMQYAVALAKDVKFRFYAVGGEYQGFTPDLDAPDHSQALEPFLEMAMYFAFLPDNQLPSVLSISYGANEQLWPERDAKQICNLLGILAVRGVSVIAASGDQGAGISCQSNDGSKKVRFLPSFPGTCPYVTAVGATQRINPEEALAYSSGGFSEYWSTPIWQKIQVKRYLEKHGKEWEGHYNPAGRAVPDLATQGDWNHPFFYHGEEIMTGGTSVSAPQFAAMIALINNARAQNGEPALGFLNPLLYLGAGDAFTDIVKGNSTGCPGRSRAGLPSPFVPNAGWAAVEGWDPVTGIGTPLFDKLLRLAGN